MINKIKLESKETQADTSLDNKKNVRVLEMRLISQNTSISSITSPLDKRVEEIKMPFSTIVKTQEISNKEDLIN